MEPVHPGRDPAGARRRRAQPFRPRRHRGDLPAVRRLVGRPGGRDGGSAVDHDHLRGARGRGPPGRSLLRSVVASRRASAPRPRAGRDGQGRHTAARPGTRVRPAPLPGHRAGFPRNAGPESRPRGHRRGRRGDRGCAPRRGLPAGRAEPPGLPTGAVGFSYSAGPVLLALDREESARHGDFAVLFGGYDDLVDVVRFLTTGRHRDLGTDYGGEALPEGRWIVLQANADAIAGPSDRAILKEIGRLKRRAADADIEPLAASLGPSGRAVLDLFANTDPARFDALYLKVDPALRATLEALSPARSLRRPLDIDLFLLHGRSDAIVPFTESLKLGRRVRTSGAVHLALLGGFRHARPQDDGEGLAWEAIARYPADSARILAVLEDILKRRRESP